MATGAQLFFWLLVILVLIVVLMVAFVFVRRYIRDDDPVQTSAAPFTLGDLRQMLKQGKLTQEEYDLLRDQIITVAKKNKPAPAGPTKPGEPPIEPPIDPPPNPLT